MENKVKFISRQELPKNARIITMGLTPFIKMFLKKTGKTDEEIMMMGLKDDGFSTVTYLVHEEDK